MKHASRGFLPQKILRKKKHGFGMPFGLWMRDHDPLKEFARENLQGLKSRRLVRADYIDDRRRNAARGGLKGDPRNHGPVWERLIRWITDQLNQDRGQ